MLKKVFYKRIIIATLALIILVITYFFPTSPNEVKFKQNLTYEDISTTAIYLIDKQELVSRVNLPVSEKEDILNKIKEIIKLLTINSNESEYIPTNFYGVIPSGTTLNNLSLENGLLKIDFSKNFLNTNKNMERKMLESLIYSLTEINEVKNILIYVDGEQLTELPFSKEKLPSLLNKDFGVNKVVEINSLKNTSKTTIYYGARDNDVFYYVPITYVANTDKEKVEIIIEKLKSAPLYESNLISYLHTSAEITNYEILENEIKLSFNEYLLDDLNNSEIIEKVQYTIFLSIRDTYDINKVEFNVTNGEKNENLLK